MAVARNPRAGIDDRWHKRVKGPDGTMRKERAATYGKVSRWRVRWVDETGEEHTKVFSHKDAAQSYLDKVTADVVKGEYVSPRSAAVTFGVVASEWLESKGVKAPKTVAGYRSLLNTLILPRWRETKLKDITHGDVQRWISGLSVDGSVRAKGKGLSASRVNQAHQCMSAVLKYGIRTGRLAKNPATGVELPRKASAEHHYLTHAQLLKLAAVLDDEAEYDWGSKVGTLTLILGYCGLRTGEARALRVRDIKDHTITVRASVTKVDGLGYVEGDTKTHRRRWVPVPEFLWDRLEYGALGGKPDDLVFPGRDDGYLTDFEYRRWFDLAAEKIGVPGLTPHELRHTCASLAIKGGANIKAVQRLLGHETASMTLDEYGHLYSDDLTNVAKTLNKAAQKATAV